jgi:4-hydroxy-3-methylbut-2-enyl diphosphate reductase
MALTPVGANWQTSHGMGASMEQTYFRKGFGLKKELRPLIDAEYQSALVERIRSRGYTDSFGDVTVRLAQEFGFCYGVDRAVDYAYETVHKFPDKRIHLVGEIIHNPHVNQRMTEMGISFIYPAPNGSFDFSALTPDDVVILPAFGVTLEDFSELSEIGCILVDTARSAAFSSTRPAGRCCMFGSASRITPRTASPR